MKKLLGISLVAIFAASPMMAMADNLPTITLLGNPAGTVASESNIATTSYVKGAYNDLAGKINTDRGAINTLNGTVETAGSVLKSIKDNGAGATYDNTTSELEATTVQGAIDELKSAVDTVSTTAGSTYQRKTDSEVTAEALTQNGLTNGVDLVTGQSVGTNLVAVAKKAKANAGEITTLKGDVNTAGSVLKSIKDNASGADYDHTISGLTATTVKTAIDELKSNMDTAATTAGNTYQAKTDSEVTTEALTAAGLTDGTDLTHGQGVGANLVTVATKAKANAGEITTLKGDVNTTGSVLKSIKDNAASATYDNATSGLSASTVQGAIDAVAASAATANSKNTVVVYSDWNSGGTPTGPQKVSVITEAAADAIINPQP